MRTENLVILFTDIVGFTENSSQLSRAQNKRILEEHNRILLPVVRRFKGRVVKTIGDSFLLTFRSPTDAMICAMAMQDSLHEYNLQAAEGEKIEIRIAASLGEVRVTSNDIFGEPVNVTSRIESITPPNEIYFSEAVYLAMNKGEVPAKEVGDRTFKGVSRAVKIYCIPPYTSHRLVPDSSEANSAKSALSYPYGGAHLLELSGEDQSFSVASFLTHPAVVRNAAIGVGVGLTLGVASLFLSSAFSGSSARTQVEANATNQGPADEAEPPLSVLSWRLEDSASQAESPDADALPVADESSEDAALSSREDLMAEAFAGTESAGDDNMANEDPAVLAALAGGLPVSSAETKAQEPGEPEAGNRTIATLLSNPRLNEVPSKALRQADAPVRKAPPKPRYTRFSQLKTAYRAGKISKAKYSQEVRQLKVKRKNELVRLKERYRAGRLEKSEYKRQYRAAKLRYE